MSCFYTTLGKTKNEPLIFYYRKQSSFLQFIIVNLSCTKSAYNNERSLGWFFHWSPKKSETYSEACLGSTMTFQRSRKDRGPARNKDLFTTAGKGIRSACLSDTVHSISRYTGNQVFLRETFPNPKIPVSQSYFSVLLCWCSSFLLLP